MIRQYIAIYLGGLNKYTYHLTKIFALNSNNNNNSYNLFRIKIKRLKYNFNKRTKLQAANEANFFKHLLSTSVYKERFRSICFCFIKYSV